MKKCIGMGITILESDVGGGFIVATFVLLL